LTTLLQLLGPHGAGKTTLMPGLAMALGGLLATDDLQLLLLDAAVDQRLSRTALGTISNADKVSTTLTHLAQGLMDKPMDDDAARREFIDWAFHDLPVTMPDDWLATYKKDSSPQTGVEVMALGPLRERLPERLWQGLVYGLQRVVENHELVLIDEDHPLVRASFQKQGTLRTLFITTPQHGPETWPPLPEAETIHLVINRYDGSPLQPAIAERIESGAMKLVGRIPVYPDADTLHDRLADDWRDCLMRVNIPLRQA